MVAIVESGSLANKPIQGIYTVEKEAIDDLLAKPSLEGMKIRAVAKRRIPYVLSSYTIPSGASGELDSERVHQVLAELKTDPQPYFHILTELATMPTKDFPLSRRTAVMAASFAQHPITTLDTLAQLVPGYPLVVRPLIIATAEAGEAIWTHKLSALKSVPKIVGHWIKNAARGLLQEVPGVGIVFTAAFNKKITETTLSDKRPEKIKLQVKSARRNPFGMNLYKTIATYNVSHITDQSLSS